MTAPLTTDSPGKLLATLDLPKATHALLFDRNARLSVQPEADGVRIAIREPGGAVEILIDDVTLDALLALIAQARAQAN